MGFILGRNLRYCHWPFVVTTLSYSDGGYRVDETLRFFIARRRFDSRAKELGLSAGHLRNVGVGHAVEGESRLERNNSLQI